MDADLQNKYMEMQILDRQLKQIQQQLSVIDQQVMELDVIKQAFVDLPNVKPGSEMLVPISAGIYAKAKIETVDELIVNVGSNVAVTKSLKDSEAMIDEQISELRSYQMKLSTDMNMLVQRAQEIEKDIVASSKKEKNV